MCQDKFRHVSAWGSTLALLACAFIANRASAAGDCAGLLRQVGAGTQITTAALQPAGPSSSRLSWDQRGPCNFRHVPGARCTASDVGLRNRFRSVAAR